MFLPPDDGQFTLNEWQNVHEIPNHDESGELRSIYVCNTISYSGVIALHFLTLLYGRVAYDYTLHVTILQGG